MHDVMTVAWKELKEFLGGQGGRRSGPMRIVFLVLIGVLFAARTSTFGSSWKTVVIIAYMANVVALSLVPDSFAGERERHTLETLLASRLSDRSILFGKYVAVVLYSVLTAAAVLVLGLITSAVTSRGAGVHVRPEVIASSVGASLLVAGLMTGLGVLISLRSETVKQAQQFLSYAFLIVVFVPLLGSQALPPATRLSIARWFAHVGATNAALVAAAIVLALDLVFLVMAMARFQRAKLITA